MFFFFFNTPAPPDSPPLPHRYPLPFCPLFPSPPIDRCWSVTCGCRSTPRNASGCRATPTNRRFRLAMSRSEEHTSELHSPNHLLFPLLLSKKNTHKSQPTPNQYVLLIH